MKILDLRLLKLTLKTRINSLRFLKSEYFKTGAQVAAFEHRSVMQVLIFLVADIVGSPQLEAIRAYLDWYLCCNAATHTERSLTELQAKSARLVELLTAAFPEQKSKWNLIKTHLMTHFIPGIRRAGNVQEYSTNLFEHLHSTLLKQIYRRSNKRKVDTQIMKHHEMKLDSISNVPTDGVQTAMQT
ncbi:unnamed protein product, partial [Closterium sp. NIES-54]